MNHKLINKILKTESNDQKIKKEKQNSIKSNLESSKPKRSTNLNDSVEISDVKKQKFCHYRKILYTQWFVKQTEWLTNGHIDVFQNLVYDNFKYQGFKGFINPSKLESKCWKKS